MNCETGVEMRHARHRGGGTSAPDIVAMYTLAYFPLIFAVISHMLGEEFASLQYFMLPVLITIRRIPDVTDISLRHFFVFLCYSKTGIDYYNGVC